MVGARSSSNTLVVPEIEEDRWRESLCQSHRSQDASAGTVAEDDVGERAMAAALALMNCSGELAYLIEFWKQNFEIIPGGPAGRAPDSLGITVRGAPALSTHPTHPTLFVGSAVSRLIDYSVEFQIELQMNWEAGADPHAGVGSTPHLSLGRPP